MHVRYPPLTCYNVFQASPPERAIICKNYVGLPIWRGVRKSYLCWQVLEVYVLVFHTFCRWYYRIPRIPSPEDPHADVFSPISDASGSKVVYLPSQRPSTPFLTVRSSGKRNRGTMWKSTRCAWSYQLQRWTKSDVDFLHKWNNWLTKGYFIHKVLQCSNL